MALIKCAGFDYLTTLAPASALASLGFTNATILPGQGRAGGGCAKLGQINLPARLGTFYCGFAIENTSGVTVNFNDSTKGTNFSLKFTSAGAITCTPQYSSNPVSSPPMAVIPGAVWQYIEVYGVIAATGGAVTVRVNETIVLSLVSANTQNNGSTGVDQLDFGSLGNAIVDDFYICDNTGASLNNFIGNTRVPAQVPSGAGVSTQWTPTGSASSNWQLASNPYMDDSSYVSCATAGDIDLYTLSPVANAPQILAVQSIVVARQDDSGQRQVKSVIQSGAVQAVGAVVNTNASYAAHTDIFATDPNTGGSWTYAAVNALQVGAKLIS
ncbi:MAG: hypothetical protein KGI37_05115 [Alphaproteobacteria bacterium]|nr:hypothetical protein [Alphaproteobacteria bacterium]